MAAGFSGTKGSRPVPKRLSVTIRSLNSLSVVLCRSCPG
ncbi:hypothetical protein C4K38_3247 [Pseudomonas chlororaphis subsp. piscium]|nr:hypothetical protein C4K38_3247 [Pseudomonas chlororaphis subsp. piscium]